MCLLNVQLLVEQNRYGLVSVVMLSTAELSVNDKARMCLKYMAEMNGFRFFKSKPNPTISFQNPIQIRQTDSFKIKILFKSKILSIVFC